MDQLYDKLAAASVRGYALRTGSDLSAELMEKPLEALTENDVSALIDIGNAWGIKLYRFKRGHEELPRVKFALGFLRAIYPKSLCDVGSGRGVFLFPFLDQFPYAQVTSLELLDYRAQLLNDLHTGGVSNLTTYQEDVCTQPLPDKSVDVVTALEVLEHIPDVQAAIQAAVNMSRRYVVVTVPSKPDNNPEHIHLLTRDLLTEYFHQAGCTRLQFGGVLDHLTLIAKIDA